MRQIFVNLPVKDLERSKNFFSSLGFGFDARFTDDKAACLVIEKDSIYAMLITEPFFKTFTGKAIKEQDHGFMYYRSFEDPDGHIWELLHMRSEPQ